MRYPQFQVYIAGPYSPTASQKLARSPEYGRSDHQFVRACIEMNAERAKLLGVEVAKLGVYPVIPHANTDHPGFDVQSYDFWIDGTLEQMKRCDAVLMMHDWKDSVGAVGEYNAARARAMLVFESLEDLATYLERFSLN